jgi:hypothetical protein
MQWALEAGIPTVFRPLILLSHPTATRFSKTVFKDLGCLLTPLLKHCAPIKPGVIEGVMLAPPHIKMDVVFLCFVVDHWNHINADLLKPLLQWKASSINHWLFAKLNAYTINTEYL